MQNEEAYMSKWCETKEVEGVRYFRNPNLPIHLFNFVTRLWNYPHGPSLLEEVERYYGELSLPHRLFLGPKEPKHLERFLIDNSYSLLSKRLILGHDLSCIPQAGWRTSHVKAIAEPADIQDWVNTALESWKHPSFPVDFDRLIASIVCAGLEAKEFICYLAQIEGRSVGTGIMNKTGNLGGIHAITTAPSARGRGVASSVVSRALADAAAQGLGVVCLQTGKGDGADTLYQDMGFKIHFELAKFGQQS